MLALEIELLGGRFVATAYNDREEGEWPPHPARLFSALVATWAEGAPDTDGGRAERAALEWLEQQAAPSIVADGLDAVARRSVSPVFVPVNDVAVVKQPEREREALRDAEDALAAAADDRARTRAEAAHDKARAALAAATRKATAAPAKPKAAELAEAEATFPDRRGRQARTFPSVTPATPRVRFVWEVEAPAPVRAGLGALAARLVRLGHSSTLVSARLADDAQAARYVVDEEGGSLTLRWVGRGQVERLEEAYARHREVEPRVMPAVFVTYREVGERPRAAAVPSAFSPDLIVFARVGGPRLPTTSTAGVARQLLRALQSKADQPVPEIISGHRADGAASQRPHLAVVPLPFVGFEHADGGIRGVALVLPRELSGDERRAVMVAVARLERDAPGEDEPKIVPLHLGDSGVLQLQRVAWGEPALAVLQGRTWCRPAREWITATPLALDENPGDLHAEDPERRARAFAEAEESVARAAEHLGLPRPSEVEVSRSVLLPGAAKPRAFPRFPVSRDRPQRVLVHVRLRFREAVRGPVLLGAGRYQGLGLFRPIDEEVQGGDR